MFSQMLYREELDMPTELGYYYRMNRYCVDCNRELTQAFLDSDEQQAHYHHYQWGPICRRCNHARANTGIDYDTVFRNDDDEVYA